MTLKARDITMISLFVALMVVSALISRFFPTIVPFSLQPFIALLAGVMLGKRLGPLAMVIYVLLGLVGIPVFAKAPFGGFSYVLQPTFGFLIGFALAAYVIGWLTEKKRNSMSRSIVATILGVVIIYLVGLPYLYLMLKYVIQSDQATWMFVLKIGFLPFILLDLVKAVVASFIGITVLKRLPQLADRNLASF